MCVGSGEQVRGVVHAKELGADVDLASIQGSIGRGLSLSLISPSFSFALAV